MIARKVRPAFSEPDAPHGSYKVEALIRRESARRLSGLEAGEYR